MSDRAGQEPHEGAPLLAEFERPGLEAWHAEVLRLLKGKPYEQVMVTETLEGISLEPIYTRQAVGDLSACASTPGEPPFLRGVRPAGSRIDAWEVAQELQFPMPADLSAALRDDLARGQTMVNLVPDDATRAGRDPDRVSPGLVGHGGTSLACVGDVSDALAGVDPASSGILLQPTAAPLAHLALLVGHLRDGGMSPEHLRGCVGTDPLALLAGGGIARAELDPIYDETAALHQWTRRHGPGARSLWVHTDVYHEAGAHAVQELAFALATAVEHLRQGERRGIDPASMATSLQFGFSVGAHFFMEIAKLRAARMLWWQVVHALGDDGAATAMRIHARTSRLSQTAFDPHVNILRAATEALAAIIGGCDSLHVAPFDDALGPPSELARRLARNTQLILREEVHLHEVIDPAGGSWFVESLTHQLAERGWALFQEIEAAGGMLAALEAGEIQDAVAPVAARRLQRLAERADRLVGVTHYPNAEEGRIERRWPDPVALHRERCEALARWRAGAGNGAAGDGAAAGGRAGDTGAADGSAVGGAAAGKALDHVATGSAQDPEAWVDAAAAAARAGATLGELTAAIRGAPGPADGTRVRPLAACRGAHAYEALREAVLAWREREGQGGETGSAHVFLANMGPVADYMPRLDFARSFFQLAGLSVAGDDWFDEAQEAAQAARASGAGIVAIVGPDETYAAVAEELTCALKAVDRPPLVVLAGYPKGQVEALRAAGVDEFIHLKTDALAVLKDLAGRIGGSS